VTGIGAIFVGGASRRMGGVPKGLLIAPSGEPIVERLARILGDLGLSVVLVGDASRYGGSGLSSLADATPGKGPLGGLVAALAAGDPVLAVACDLPRLPPEVLARLLAAPPAPIVAPIVSGIPQPLCARYSATVLPVCRARLGRGALSLRGVLDEVGVTELPVSAEEAENLGDWDSPEDVR
jgi:molybdopterin-guanine dinucleotide biosynthesis protein A